MELTRFDNKKTDNSSLHIATREVTRTTHDRGDSDSFLSNFSLPGEANRLSRVRWLGLAIICLLNIVSGLNWFWFSAISVDTYNQLGITLSRVNWLANSVSLVYLPVCVIVPLGFSRWGFRTSYIIGSTNLLIAGWIRYIGTTQTLDSNEKYALLLIGQVFTGFAQPWFQILGSKYSETWFDSRGRTTATMVIAVANPIGAALSQVIAPAFPTVRKSVLNLAIITSAVAPTAIFIASKPPMPRSYVDSDSPPPATQVLRALIGRTRPGEFSMFFRERVDTIIITLLFDSFVGAFTASSNLISQIFIPYGYSSDEAGVMGGVLILAGIVGAASLSPILDRFFANRLALAAKLLVPLLAAGYIALIWGVRRDNYAGIYTLMVVIGITSFTLLPIALEIGCRVTHSAETSSAMLWFVANLLSVVLVVSMDALRDDSPSANPPSNMFKSLIFQACFVGALSISVFALKAQQTKHVLRRVGTARFGAREEGLE